MVLRRKTHGHHNDTGVGSAGRAVAAQFVVGGKAAIRTPPVGLRKDSSPQAVVKVLPLSCSCEEIFLHETALTNVTTGSPSSIFQGTTVFLLWPTYDFSLLFLCLSPTNPTKANWRLFKAEVLRQRMLDDVQRCSGFSASLSSGQCSKDVGAATAIGVIPGRHWWQNSGGNSGPQVWP
ncbi:hypothetical protein NL676_025543 [Syzygium grande]|nr:hypothetical protein NL676_025543 [Syzygium grande]